MSATSITVNLHCAVLSVVQFTVPTIDNWPTVDVVPADPDTVELWWTPKGGTRTTWTYGEEGTDHIVKVATGVFAATIPSRTLTPATTTKILGLWNGIGGCTATCGFTVTLLPNVAA